MAETHTLSKRYFQNIRILQISKKSFLDKRSEWKEKRGKYLAGYTSVGDKTFSTIEDAKNASLLLEADGMPAKKVF